MLPVRYTLKHLPSEKAVGFLPYVHMAGSFRCEENYITKRKKYDSLLLVLTHSGKGYLKYDFKEYVIPAQTGFIIDCNRPHVYFSDKKELWNFSWVHFHGEQATKQVSFIHENSGPVFKDDKNSIIESNLSKILETLHNRGLYYDILLANSLNEILGELQIKRLRGENDTQDLPEVVKKSISIIESQYPEKLTLDYLAGMVYCNKFDLTRKFKRYMGISPYGYLIKHRIVQSKNLLDSTKLSIAEIAASVGFENTSHFIKIFKRHEKTTPLKYRQYW